MAGAYGGHVSVLAFLLDHGFLTEERDKCLRTCIHYAVKNGHLPVVRYLVSRGCDVDRLDEGQASPLVYAAASNNVPIFT
jgi:ankyrin repeat protein